MPRPENTDVHAALSILSPRMDWPLLLLIPASFLMGSIPFSWLLGKAKGVDIRTVGSGNAGATNLGRALGRSWFFAGFTLDLLKGLLPVVVAGALLGTLGRYVAQPVPTLVWIACGLAAVLGHIFTPWLGFRGGKGVATGIGVVLGMFPVLTIVGMLTIALYLLVLWRWRYVSLGSIIGACSMPLWFVALVLVRAQDPLAGLTSDSGPLYLGLTVVLALVVVLTHRANIRRLRMGTEPKIGTRASAPRPAPAP